jgi:hypothetical protein
VAVTGIGGLAIILLWSEDENEGTRRSRQRSPLTRRFPQRRGCRCPTILERTCLARASLVSQTGSLRRPRLHPPLIMNTSSIRRVARYTARNTDWNRHGDGSRSENLGYQ